MPSKTDNDPASPDDVSPNASSARLGLARPRDTGAGKISLSPQEAAKTVEELRRLCRTKGEELNALDRAAKALQDSGYKQELTKVLREAVSWPDAHPRVGALWVRRLVSSNNWDRTYPDALDELCRRGEIGHRAVIEFLAAVAEKGRPQLVKEAVRKHGQWLAEDPDGWSVAAKALAKVRLHHLAARWMSDWRGRPELNLELLFSLALALRGSGREREAHEVVVLALGKPGAALQYPILHLWFAEEEALAGKTESATVHLQDVRPVGWEEDAVNLFYLTRGVIRVQRADRDSRGEAFAAAYDRIRDQFRRRRVHEREVTLRRQYRRCVCRMARDTGRWWPALLATWRSADRWSALIPLLLVPGLQIFAPLYLMRLCTNRRGREK